MQPENALRASRSTRRSPRWTSQPSRIHAGRGALVGDADLVLGVAEQAADDRRAEGAGSAGDEHALHAGEEASGGGPTLCARAGPHAHGRAGRARRLWWSPSGAQGLAGSHAAPRTDPASLAARANVPVLCWHQIRSHERGRRARPQYIVSPGALAAQLEALDRAGYHAVTGEALVAHVASASRSRPSRSC